MKHALVSAPNNRIHWSHTSIVLRLRRPGLGGGSSIKIPPDYPVGGRRTLKCSYQKKKSGIHSRLKGPVLVLLPVEGERILTARSDPGSTLEIQNKIPEEPGFPGAPTQGFPGELLWEEM